MADGDILSFDDPSGTELFAIDTSGNVAIAGTLAVTGAVTLSAALTLSGILDLNGLADGLVLDADADTTISAPTDDQIDVELGGVDHVVLKAVAAADAAATTAIQEIAFSSPADTTGTNTHVGLIVDVEIGNASGGTNNVYGIHVDDTTSDAEVTATGLKIGAGWDVGLNLDSPLDLDLALTAAGDAANVYASVNHATAAAEGLDVHVEQITTNRTSGRVAGVKSKVTSLSGDTAAVVYAAFEAAVTAGEANADHVVIYSEDAFDFFLVAAASGDAGATVGAMTAKSPETDAEAGYLTIQVSGTSYEIPFYAVV